MANPVTGEVEVKGTMNVSQEDWDAIFNKGKTEEIKEDNNENQ